VAGNGIRNDLMSINIKVGETEKHILFTYSTEHFAKKDKVRFYYALKGRDGKTGIVGRTNAEHLGSAVILAPANSEQEWEEFFTVWSIPFSKKSVILEK
jgi:hypothetical protein